jgi:hypothetical protein
MNHKIRPTPLIFVPGILGSRLFKGETSEPIWPPIGWWDKGHFKPKSLREIKQAAVIKTSQNEPLFPLVYSELLRYLEMMGYFLGTNFWIFPYDWTQSNRISGKQLALFIRNILATHPQWEQVDIINHSMGGLVTRAAVKFYSAPVRRTVYITCPHFGSPKAFFVLHPRIEFPVFGSFFRSMISDLAWKWYLHRVASLDTGTLEKEIKSLARQLDSILELLPDRFYFEQNQPLVIKKSVKAEAFVRGLEETYFKDLCQFPSAELQQRIRQAMRFKEDLGNFLPGKENLVIYSDSEETFDQIVILGYAGWRFGRYRDSGQKGDILVPVNSATLNNPAGARRVSGSHNGVPNSQETSLLIKAFLEKY